MIEGSNPRWAAIHCWSGGHVCFKTDVSVLNYYLVSFAKDVLKAWVSQYSCAAFDDSTERS